MLCNTGLTVTSHETPFLFLYELIAIRETFAHAFSYLMVAKVTAVEHDRTEFLYVYTAVVANDTLIDMSLHDLADDTVAAKVITDAHHLALHSEQIIVKHGSIVSVSTFASTHKK